MNLTPAQVKIANWENDGSKREIIDLVQGKSVTIRWPDADHDAYDDLAHRVAAELLGIRTDTLSDREINKLIDTDGSTDDDEGRSVCTYKRAA